MSRQDIPDTASSQRLPIILAVHRGQHNLIKQLYDPCFTIECSDAKMSAPAFFNMAQKPYVGQKCIMGFLSEYDYLTSPHSLDVVSSSLAYNAYFGAVYSDSLLRTDISIPIIMPVFNRKTYENMVVNTPLFIHSGALAEWDESLKDLYFFDMFKKLGEKTMLAHIPQPIISSMHHNIDNEEVTRVKNNYV